MTSEKVPVYAYVVDESGHILHADLHYGGELPDNFVLDFVPLGIHRPRWTGSEWVEDLSQAEIDEKAFWESLTPSAEEIANAEFELKILSFLMEVELI